MAFTDIFKLRPDAPTSASIREALGRAVVADQAERGELTRLEQERNDLLLDGTADTLKKAETALCAARDAAGRVGVVRQQLEQRLNAALEAETTATVDTAREAAEAASRAHGEWWAKSRVHLAKVLQEGMRLREQASDTHQVWKRQVAMAEQSHPGRSHHAPAIHVLDHGGWPADLANRARTEEFFDLADVPRPFAMPEAVPITVSPPRVETGGLHQVRIANGQR